LYQETFLGSAEINRARATINPLKYSTSLSIECELAQECGMPLSQYQALPRLERRTMYLHLILKGAKEKYQLDEAKKKADMERNKHSSKPRKIR
jgi:hypothetical protein